MKKNFTLLGIAILFSSAIIAQTKQGKISGSVKDAEQKTVPSATVSLLRVNDSSLVKFAATNKNGVYEFNEVADGRYLLSVTSVGYNKVLSVSFEISGSNPAVVVPVITLSEQAKS